MIVESEYLEKFDKFSSKVIFVLDPNEEDTRLIKLVLEKKRGYVVKVFKNSAKALRELHETSTVDLIITEYDLEGKKNGLDLITHVNVSFPNPPPIIMLSNQTSEQIAVDAIKYGAMDYIAKDRGWYNQLPLRIVHTLVHRQIINENKELKELKNAVFEHSFDSIVVTDNSNNIILSNDKFAELVEIPKNELENNFKISRLFQSRDYLEKILDELHQGHIIKDYKATLLNKESFEVPISFSAVKMHHINKSLFIFSDLRVKEEMLRQINELKKFARSSMVISAFKVGQNGPEIVCSEQNPLYTEELLMKMAIFFSVSLGQGDRVHSGVYGPLPLPTTDGNLALDKFVSLIYSFTINDDENEDVRAHGKSYCLLTVNIPENIVDVFYKRKILAQLFSDLLLEYNIQEVKEISEEFLLAVKEKILSMEIEL